jgi:hypothetical protein
MLITWFLDGLIEVGKRARPARLLMRSIQERRALSLVRKAERLERLSDIRSWTLGASLSRLTTSLRGCAQAPEMRGVGAAELRSKNGRRRCAMGIHRRPVRLRIAAAQVAALRPRKLNIPGSRLARLWKTVSTQSLPSTGIATKERNVP